MCWILDMAGCPPFFLVAACAAVVWLSCAFAAARRLPAVARPASRRDLWRVLGPGGGGSDMTAAAVSPHDPDLMCVAAEMTGTYISRDGGRSWRMINLGQVVYSLVFDPLRPNVLYAASIFVWRSDDTGETWSRIYPSPGKRTRFYYQGDHAFHVVMTKDASYPQQTVERVFVTAIAVHPRDPDRLFIAHKGDWRQTIPAAALVSRDGGRNWEIVRILDREIVSAADIDPDTSQVTFASESAVYVHDGRRMERMPAPYGCTFNCVSLGRRGDSLLIYATTDAAWDADRLTKGIVVSADRGRTWKQIAGVLGALVARRGGTKVPRFRAVGCSANNAGVAYVGFRNLVLGASRDYVYNGIAATNDGGASWKILRKELRLSSLDPLEGYQRRRLPAGDIWFDEPARITVAPANPGIVLVSDLFRTLVSRDGGRSWHSANASAAADGRFATRGIDVSVCFGVVIDPFNSKNVYALFGNLGIWKSADAGATWRGLCEGVPLEWRRCAYWLEFDPAVEGLAWAAVSGTHDLPRPKMWRRRGISTYRGGVLVTTDGGEHWTPAWPETQEMAVTHVLLDPKSPPGRRTLYACGFGRGVMKSTDGGRTWELANNGIEYEEPFAWRLTLSADGMLYLVIARRHEWGESRPSGIGALYRSADGARRWERMPLPETVDGPVCLLVDAADTRRLYLAAWGRYTGGEDVGGGIFITADGGGTWHKGKLDDLHVYDVTMDPRNNTLYAVGFESSAYRSCDRGETWQRIRGYNFKWGHRVTPDPSDENMIYIATFGGGIWHGPAAGDPNAREDLLTPFEKTTCD